MTPERVRVLLVFGGRSEEHEVSVVSASAVARALDPERYEVVSVGIDKGGRWHRLPGPHALEAGGADQLPSVGPDAGSEISLSREPGKRELVSDTGERQAVDVVLPILHGPFGEDGTIQGLFELAGIPYVGAGVLASAVGMDKAVQKVLFRAAGLPVVRHEVVHDHEWDEDQDAITGRVEALGTPVFVKPAALGSSVGITKVKSLADLPEAMAEAFRHGRKAVVEESAEGAREVEVGVLGNDDPVASLPAEIIPKAEFYDYRAKYLDDATELRVPADLPEEVVDEVQRMAVAAFRAIDCAGMARVDFFYREPRELIVNEINTIPGFTEVSMYPRMWEASGVPYPELLDRLIALALERHEHQTARGPERPAPA